MLASDSVQVSIKGKLVRVPSARLGGKILVVNGRYLRIASVHDAQFNESEAASDPGQLLRDFEASGLKADILTFSQRIDDSEPRYPYPYEWDNAAVACSSNYDEWWNGLPQEARKNVRRAAKRGVTVDVVAFDQALIEGIKRLYDESPVRQGRRFWHYGKDLEAVRAENSSYLDRSEFIGAYFAGEVIGFMKMVYVGNTAMIMQILAASAHHDKRPMNAMIAKAMEVCHRRGIAYLVYSKFTFGNKKHDDMAEFKRRNGFVQLMYPKYFVPLTLKGRAAFALRLHRGLLGVLPSGVIHRASKVRSRLLGRGATGVPGDVDHVGSTSTVQRGETG